jgi:crotonobetainyl-CoA:carnitine CoA-transferase CaiB-like acyl-CoA transferase
LLAAIVAASSKKRDVQRRPDEEVSHIVGYLLKVIDLSSDIAGQWAAKLFAMSGAEVVRPIGPPRPPALARYLDAFKRVVPWTGPSLLADADVVFTTFDGGRRVGYAADLEPSDDYVEIMTSTYGATGPYASMRGGPLAAWAAGGYLAITGEADREPLVGPEHLCGYVHGYTAAIAAEAALRERRRCGKGRRVDIGAMESMITVHQSTFGRFALGDVRKRTGRYYEVYPLVTRPCQDGYVLLCVVTDDEYDRFLIAVDRLDLLHDERFATRSAANEHRDEFDTELAPFLEARDAQEIVDILAAHGVVAGKVAEAEDVLANPQLAHRGFWATGPGPGNPVPPSKVYAGPAKSSPSPLYRGEGSRQHSSCGPLEGIVVADFTVFWAGPLATRTLADLGARVIWVERPRSRDNPDLTTADTLTMVQYLTGLEMNRRKESVVLDLTTPEGYSAARDLLALSDVVVENNRPGVMDGLGLGPADMCASHPQLVYVSLSGWGSTGPWAQRRSYGPAIEAASSIEARTGYKEGQPLRLGHPLPDGVGGLAGAYAAIRGLRERDVRGFGGWFDVSQLETYVAMSGEDLVDRGPVPRIGNRSRWGVRQGVYPCRGDEEWIAVRLDGDADVEAFTAATGVDACNDAALAAFTAGRDRLEVTRLLQDAGIEAFPALKPADLIGDPQLRHRGYLLEVPFRGETIVLPGSPFFGLADPTGRVPRFGEHTQPVLAEIETLLSTGA